MPSTSYVQSLAAAVALSFSPFSLGGGGHPAGQGPTQGSPSESAAAAKGGHCPREFQAVVNDDTKGLTCRREVGAWDVTSCREQDLAKCVAKSGPDSCGPTE